MREGSVSGLSFFITTFDAMLSTSCRYALKALVFLTAHARRNTPTGIKDIAAGIDANEHTTAKILQVLVREGMIESVKGPNGGFFIDTDKNIFLIDVVRVVDGDHFFHECALGLKVCSSRKPCPLHHQYTAVRENLHRQFCTISIGQLSQDTEAGKAYLKL